jgi:hypothetical protein
MRFQVNLAPFRDEIEAVTQARGENARRNGYRELKVDGRDGLTLTRIGVAGEVIIREALPGSHVPLCVLGRDLGIDGWYDGWSMSVKASERYAPNLVVRDRQEIVADVFQVVSVNLDAWKGAWTGWVTKADFIRLGHRIPGRPGTWVDLKDFRTPAAFLDLAPKDNGKPPANRGPFRKGPVTA